MHEHKPPFWRASTPEAFEAEMRAQFAMTTMGEAFAAGAGYLARVAELVTGATSVMPALPNDEDAYPSPAADAPFNAIEERRVATFSLAPFELLDDGVRRYRIKLSFVDPAQTGDFLATVRPSKLLDSGIQARGTFGEPLDG